MVSSAFQVPCTGLSHQQNGCIHLKTHSLKAQRPEVCEQQAYIVSCYCNETHDRSDFREKGIILANSWRVQSILAGKSWLHSSSQEEEEERGRGKEDKLVFSSAKLPYYHARSEVLWRTMGNLLHFHEQINTFIKFVFKRSIAFVFSL